MTQDPVVYSRDGDVATITLADGGRGNPLHPASVAALHGAVRRAYADRARVVVLRAEGRFFCVGGDLAGMAASEDRGRYLDDLAEALHRVILDLHRLDAVVVSVVQGAAAGAGFPLAAAADIVLASSAAGFSLAYTKVGLSIDGGSSLLTETLGLHRMLRLALLNDALDAEEAQAAGLVARVFAPDELDDGVAEIVARLAAGPPGAYARARRLLRQAAHPDAAERMARESHQMREQAATAEGHEGVDAFLDKRAPEFGSGS